MQGPEPYLEKLGIQLPCAVDPGATAVLEPSHRVIVNGQFYWASSPQRAALLRASPHSYSGPIRDPVTGRWFSPTSASPLRLVGGEFYYFSTVESAEDFDRNPASYVDRE